MRNDARKFQSRKGKPYTNKAKQTRIIAASLAGKSNNQISQETGTCRATIRRILSQSEVEALMASYRDQALELVPKALERINQRLDQGEATEWLMVEIVKGLRVFMSKSETDVHHIVDELQELSNEELQEYISQRMSKVTISSPGNA